MGEISREITTELTRLVEDDLPTLDEPANATGTVSPGGMNNGSTVNDRTPDSEAAAATGEAAPPPSGGPDSLQPDNTAAEAAEQPAASGLADETDSATPPVATAAPAGSDSLPVGKSPAADLGLTPSAGQADIEEVSLAEGPAAAAGGRGVEEGSTQPEPTAIAELVGAPRPPGSPDGVPTTEP